MRPGVRETLIALAERHGGAVTPEIVLEAARDPASPLHEEFQWNDEAAAEAYRLAQARGLLKRVRVVIETGERAFAAPVFHRDPQAGRGQGYVTLGRLRTEEERAREALIAAFARAAAALTAARNLADALGMAPEVEELRAGLTRLSQRAALADASAEGRG